MTLHDRDDLGAQIVPALEQHVDIGPGVVAEPPQEDQAIERVDGPHDDQKSDDPHGSHAPYASSAKERMRGWLVGFGSGTGDSDLRVHNAVRMPALRAA